MKYGPLGWAMFAATKVLLPMDREDSGHSYHSADEGLGWGKALYDGFRFIVAMVTFFLGVLLTIGGTIFLCSFFNTGWWLPAVLPLGTLSYACIAKTWEWSTRP